MGLRKKASLYRKLKGKGQLDRLAETFAGQKLSREEWVSLQQEIQSEIKEVTSKLDRKLIDMQTLFEIGRELSSTLNIDDLLQVIIFTLMGHFQISDVAILEYKQNGLSLLAKQGFTELSNIETNDVFLKCLNEDDAVVCFTEIGKIPDIQEQMKKHRILEFIPVKGKEQLFGVIALGNKMSGEAYTETEYKFCTTLASLAGIALENAGLFQKLDRKYKELSTLYEVSKIINSSNDYELVLSLIMETISTGFGVKNAILFSAGENDFQIEQILGFNNIELQTPISFSETEIKQLKENQVGVIELSDSLSTLLNFNGHALLVPFFSVDTLVGGLLITEGEGIDLDEASGDLFSLFSIIASQLAPPILITRILKEEKTKVQDPFSPILSLILEQNKKATQYGLDVTFAMLEMINFKQYIKNVSGKTAFQRIEGLISKIKAVLPDNAIMVRYSSNKLFFIFPALAASDLDFLKESVIQETRKFFNMENEIDLSPNFLSVRSPEECEDPFAVLSYLE